MALSKSDFLADRYPYFPDEPLGEHEVTDAFGNRRAARLAEILQHGELPDEDRVRALRAVQEVLGDPRWKAEVVALGIPAVCARGIAGGWPAHAEALRQAARVLAGVARLSAGREALGKAGALGALAGLLRNSHEEVREAAAEALVAATDARDGAELLAQQPGVIQAVVHALLDDGVSGDAACPGSGVVCLHLVSVLDSLTSSPEGVAKAVEAGAVPRLLQVLQPQFSRVRLVARAGSGVDAPRELCLRALSTLCNVANDAEGKRAVIAAGLVTLSPQLMRQQEAGEGTGEGGAPPRRLALREDRLLAALLAAVAVDEAGKTAIGRSAVPALCALLRARDATTRDNARLAVRIASDNGETKQRFVAELLPHRSLLHDVFQHTATANIAALLRSDDAAVRAQAALALSDIAADSAGRTIITQTLHAVRGLASVLGEGDEEVAAAASAALAALVQGSQAARREVQQAMEAATQDRLRARLAEVLARSASA